MTKIIDIKNIEESLSNKINEIIKDSSYSQICNFIELLPRESEDLDKYGVCFINDFYKKAARIEKKKTEENKEEVLKIQEELYTLYCVASFDKIKLSFEEFIVFSLLLDNTFSDYNPNKKRKREPLNSGDEEIDSIVNAIIYESDHSEHPHAYEISSFKLKILLKTLREKRRELIRGDLDKMDVDDVVKKLELEPRIINEKIDIVLNSDWF